jgi:RHS repeat-associated protein
VNGVSTAYLYDGVNLVGETCGGVTANYVFGPGIDEPLASYRAGTLLYLAADALGTISETNDFAGNPTLSTSFDAWGVARNETGTRTHPFTYTGREVGEAGLLFYRARFLQPGVGRFTQEDPIRRGSPFISDYRPKPGATHDPLRFISSRRAFNRRLLSLRTPPPNGVLLVHGYAYVDNNPLRFNDPLGLYELQPQTPGCDVPDFFKCFETPDVRECCNAHDDCYIDFICDSTSWYSINPRDPCIICNIIVVFCIQSGQGGDSAGLPAP